MYCYLLVLQSVLPNMDIIEWDLKRIAVKVNDVEMSMHDIIVHTPKTTLPLREGSVSLSVDFFQQHSGTVVTIVTPSVKLAISLVRFFCVTGLLFW